MPAKSNPKSPRYPRELDENQIRKTEKGLAENIQHGIADEVQRKFQGASRVLAERHLESVLNYRTVYLTEQILDRLGGNLPTLLHAAGRAVTDSIKTLGFDSQRAQASQAEVVNQIMADISRLQTEIDSIQANKPKGPEGQRLKEAEKLSRRLESLNKTLESLLVDSAALGQIALAASQAVQQTAFNVQKIITVAIEASRNNDGTSPKYVYPP